MEGRLVSGPNVRYRAKASAGPMAMARSSSKPSAFKATTAPLLSNLTSAICTEAGADSTPCTKDVEGRAEIVDLRLQNQQLRLFVSQLTSALHLGSKTDDANLLAVALD